jgi:cyclophilin family peptidyl-prolyl cis-trans isomerase
MGGNQSSSAGSELDAEARAKEAAIRDEILASGCTPTSAGQYQVRVQICIDEATSGTLFVDVHPSWSPRGEARFRALMAAGWFDDCRFFRVIPGFMVQFGLAADPSRHRGSVDNSNIKDDPVLAGNSRGRIAFAHAGPNTRSNQLFINLVDNSKPGYRPYALDDKGFSAFAQVSCRRRLYLSLCVSLSGHWALLVTD